MTDSPLTGSATPPISEDFLAVLHTTAGATLPVAVFNWREAPLGSIGGIMPEIRRFTEWIILTYTIRENKIPRCWWQHPALQLELYGLLKAHEFYYQPTQEVGPLRWHEDLERALARMASITADSGCGREGHRDIQGARTGKELTHITEAEWQDLTGNPNPYVDGHSWPPASATGE
ncbi:hypothetical protein GCM10010401_08720 [Rarobacter faecitabidus]|uniref:DUF4913 domain-containing protein n=1 Tax=Rarobacter faecitabidus TaxID=13243 RepID=A0A542ZAV4_RARFA|nr:hypothetical protein [Rarobacter faecitabidus]TQL57473.1 hypothetical protein FB461_2210 [Rarobacter faecitabidus]